MSRRSQGGGESFESSRWLQVRFVKCSSLALAAGSTRFSPAAPGRQARPLSTSPGTPTTPNPKVFSLFSLLFAMVEAVSSSSSSSSSVGGRRVAARVAARRPPLAVLRCLLLLLPAVNVAAVLARVSPGELPVSSQKLDGIRTLLRGEIRKGQQWLASRTSEADFCKEQEASAAEKVKKQERVVQEKEDALKEAKEADERFKKEEEAGGDDDDAGTAAEEKGADAGGAMGAITALRASTAVAVADTKA